MCWEFWAHRNLRKIKENDYGLIGFYEHFLNPPPSFNNPMETQSNQIEKMVKLAAQETISRAGEYIKDPNGAVRKAISAVLTLWRASYSALEPDFKLNFRDGKNFLVGVIKNHEKREKS